MNKRKKTIFLEAKK